jgi:DNA gyrase subunit B
MLAFEEIRTLVTALGTGIGSADFDADKLRYHKVVIMTDADVDGSHIRTLLLTFFYRQMNDVIRRGHLYIAQPPLYKIKKGKVEKYLKNEAEFTEIIVSGGTTGVAIKSSNNVVTQGDKLKESVLSLREIASSLKTLEEEKMDVRVVKVVAANTKLISEKTFSSFENASSVVSDLKELISKTISGEFTVEAKQLSKDDKNAAQIVVSSRVRGALRHTVIDSLFLKREEVKKITKALTDSISLGEAPLVLIDSESKKELETISDITQLPTVIDERGKKGWSITRFKGLGEMNPEQLWETTMDPVNRTFLQVSIEDAIEADEIFTVLMGDEVEPRRKFIEDNALKVKNLDI